MKHASALCLLLAAVLLPAAYAEATGPGCETALKLFNQAYKLRQNSQVAVPLLEKAHAICPGNARVLNNLAVAYERLGKLKKAEQLYNKALATDRGYILPLTGLGDIAFTRGLFRQAAGRYQEFLDALGVQCSNDRHLHQCGLRPEYEAKLKRAREKVGIHMAALRGGLTQEMVTRGLKPQRVPTSEKTRSAGAVVTLPERLSLPVFFAYDSDQLSEKGKQVLAKVAAALTSRDLSETFCQVIGHTDLHGEEPYNLALSLRRAQRAADYLAALGINPDRLIAKGMGESQPIVKSGTPDEQAENRRVEFVTTE